MRSWLCAEIAQNRLRRSPVIHPATRSVSGKVNPQSRTESRIAASFTLPRSRCFRKAKLLTKANGVRTMSILSEFKAFAIKGNVIDLAVGFVVGAAFGKIVTSFTTDILMPPIGLALGAVDFSNLFINLSSKHYHDYRGSESGRRAHAEHRIVPEYDHRFP